MPEPHPPDDRKARVRAARARNLKGLGVGIAWAIPWVWLEHEAGFPDSLGVHNPARGTAGVLLDFWYSWRLIQRHHAWDIALWLWMWGPLVALTGWLVRRWRRDRRG